MRVLVACEFSGTVRDAFAARGHDAWSCDLLPTEKPGNHYQCDVLTILNDGWDLMVAHPDCRYLCNSGLHWNGRIEGRKEKTEQALEFVRKLMNAGIRRICIENPTGLISTRIRPASQYIQPARFGDDASKKTGLWLKNLPPLVYTFNAEPRIVQLETVTTGLFDGLGKVARRYSNQTDSGQNNLTPSPDRWKERARTYPGIANAMADQWGKLQ